MVGTGVFTSLGLQAVALDHGAALLALWLVGGALAFCGAVAYSELATLFPGSGGEYRYLGLAFHPALGVVAGWTSVTVGFAAPVALAALALGRYLHAAVPLPPVPVALAAVVLVTLVHLRHPGAGARFQERTTLLKLALIALFIVAGLAAPARGTAPFAPDGAALSAMASAPFAASLIYVSYAYTGWNAATYLAGELETPERTVPRALLHGTAVVTALYVALNAVFLRTVPLATLRGQVEIGTLAAAAIAGPLGARVMSGVIAALLVSTISAMVLAGPRVVETMARDLPALAPLGRRTADGLPRNALLAQLALTLALILTGSFERVMAYAGVALTLVTALTVAAVPWLRWRAPERPRAYRAWGYPLTPLVFLGFSAWILAATLRAQPAESLLGLLTVATGGVLFLLAQRRGGAARHLPPRSDAPTDAR